MLICSLLSIISQYFLRIIESFIDISESTYTFANYMTNVVLKYW